MTHYEDMYKSLLPIHEATVKQYEALEKKLFQLISLAKTSADAFENSVLCLKEKIEQLEKENTELRAKLKGVNGVSNLYIPIIPPPEVQIIKD